MGRDYYFYFQVRTSQGWIVPSNFTNQWNSETELGYFTWFDDKDMTAQLFFGRRPLLPMRQDTPPDIESTLLYHRGWPDGRFAPVWEEWFSGWMPFDELLLDCWDETTLLVSKKAAASQASLFVDGAQPFPRQQLLAFGMLPEDVDDLDMTDYYVFGDIVEEPITQRNQLHRDAFEETSGAGSERPVDVSWKVTLSSFIGDWRLKAFRNLRRFGRDDDLRILCLFS